MDQVVHLQRVCSVNVSFCFFSLYCPCMGNVLVGAFPHLVKLVAGSLNHSEKPGP